jgi:isoquinoline 1-oxidoreductase beta subunit
MTEEFRLTRRGFIKVSSAAGVGLLISIYLPGCSNDQKPVPAATSTPVPTLPPTPTITPVPTPNVPDTIQPSVFVKIGEDDIVTITVHRSEMGQGVRTALPMILAEELDVDWKNVRVEQANADYAYGDQMTGGSVSVSTSYGTLRNAGAVARDLLLTAAAQTWNCDKAKCSTDKGTVIQQDTKEQLSYGQLVTTAGTLPVPSGYDIETKKEEDFRIIGTRVGRVDNRDIVTGKAIYGMDVKVPNMLYAVVAHNPVIGGAITSFDDSKAKQVPGVRQIVKLKTGVAVVADNSWSAIQGRQALALSFDDGDNANYSSAAEEQQLLQDATVTPGKNDLIAYYVMPFLSHSPMEPMNCVVDVRADRCEVWVPSQNPMQAKQMVMGATRLPEEAITLHVPLIGGGFGRRLSDNFPIPHMMEAAQISQAIGAPIKLFWTREDDLQHDYYHPLSVTRASAKLNDVQTLINCTSRSEAGSAIPTGAWRSVENVPEAFARESFIDEYAFATKQDPVELRRQIMYGPGKTVLELAAEKAGWGTPLPTGYGRGIAYHATWGVTHVAQVAEVSVDRDGRVQVHHVVCAVDCGIVINPDMVEAQMEGGIIFGLTTALKAAVSIEQGRVQQSNFHDYPLLRLDEAPVVEVYIVPSTESPTGIGEMSNPVIMPAVANAIFAATGKRIRRLPIKPEDLKAA